MCNYLKNTLANIGIGQANISTSYSSHISIFISRKVQSRGKKITLNIIPPVIKKNHLNKITPKAKFWFAKSPWV